MNKKVFTVSYFLGLVVIVSTILIVLFCIYQHYFGEEPTSNESVTSTGSAIVISEGEFADGGFLDITEDNVESVIGAVSPEAIRFETDNSLDYNFYDIKIGEIEKAYMEMVPGFQPVLDLLNERGYTVINNVLESGYMVKQVNYVAGNKTKSLYIVFDESDDSDKLTGTIYVSQ